MSRMDKFFSKKNDGEVEFLEEPKGLEFYQNISNQPTGSETCTPTYFLDFVTHKCNGWTHTPSTRETLETFLLLQPVRRFQDLEQHPGDTMAWNSCSEDNLWSRLQSTSLLELQRKPSSIPPKSSKTLESYKAQEKSLSHPRTGNGTITHPRLKWVILHGLTWVWIQTPPLTVWTWASSLTSQSYYFFHWL